MPRSGRSRARSAAATPKSDLKMATAVRDCDSTAAKEDAPTDTSLAGDTDGKSTPAPSLKGDWHNFTLLLFLYTLQGLPMGLASSIPLFLQSRGASMADQATFGLSSWPYSLKLLWAPFVDALYTTRFGLGHRKSWIVPIQLSAGVIMIALGSHLDDVFGGPPEEAIAGAPSAHIDVWSLTASFFLLYLLVATQDIAVDGWALSLLRPENVGYASTANTVGQTAGVMMAYGLLMALDSPAFCNTWVRAPLGWPSSPSAGLVSMSGFMQFWGYFFILSTLALWALMREAPPVVGAVLGPEPMKQVPGGLSDQGELEAAGTGGPDVENGTAAPASSTGGGRGRKPSRRRAPSVITAGSPAGGSSGSSAASEASSRGIRRRTPRSSAERRAAAAAASAGSPGGSAGARSLSDNTDSDSARAGSDEGGEGEDAPLAPAVSGDSAAAVSSHPAASVAPPPTLSSALASVSSAYAELWRVVRLPSVLGLVGVLATAKLGFTAVDSATALVMQGRGVTKETIAFFDVLSTPVQLAFPLLVSRLTAGKRPMTLWLRAYPLRLACGLAYLALLYSCFAPPPGPAPSSLALGAVFALSNGHSLVTTSMFLAQISFFTQVADPGMGGSYMTLLNTVANLGNMWPRWFVLRGIDALTHASCQRLPEQAWGQNVTAATWDEAVAGGLACKSAGDKAACAALGGGCSVERDGYIYMVLLTTAVGAVWWLATRRHIKALEAAPRSAWLATAG